MTVPVFRTDSRGALPPPGFSGRIEVPLGKISPKRVNFFLRMSNIFLRRRKDPFLHDPIRNI